MQYHTSDPREPSDNLTPHLFFHLQRSMRNKCEHVIHRGSGRWDVQCKRSMSGSMDLVKRAETTHGLESPRAISEGITTDRWEQGRAQRRPALMPHICWEFQRPINICLLSLKFGPTCPEIQTERMNNIYKYRFLALKENFRMLTDYTLP